MSRIKKRNNQRLLNKFWAADVVLAAVLETGYHRFISHYYIGTDRVISYFNLPGHLVRTVLRSGKLKGIKESGRWKIFTLDALNFVLAKKVNDRLKANSYNLQVRALVYKELQKVIKSRPQ